MASFKPIIFLFFFLLLQQNLATAADLIDDTCAHIAAGDPNVNSTFCEAVLRQASGSADADLCGLAVISARLAMANATAAEAVAAEMLEEEEEEDNSLSRYERSCLESCCELYGNAGYSLDAAVGMVEAGRFDEANVWMSAAVDAPVACEEGFQEGGLASPLVEEDGVLFQLAVIALAITARLQKQ